MTIKTCVNCETPISAGVECPRCNAISSVFCLVATRYNGREMKQLADNLADCDLVEFTKDAKFNGAPTAVYIANMIERMAFAANIEKESLRLSVVRRIREHIKEIGTVFQQQVHHVHIGAIGCALQRCRAGVHHRIVVGTIIGNLAR